MSNMHRLLFSVAVASAWPGVGGQVLDEDPTLPPANPGYPSCNICGSGNEVTFPDVDIEVPGQPSISCGLLDEAGDLGFIEPDFCIDPLLIDAIGELCGCALTLPPVPTTSLSPSISPTNEPSTSTPTALFSLAPSLVPSTQSPMFDPTVTSSGAPTTISMPPAPIITPVPSSREPTLLPSEFATSKPSPSHEPSKEPNYQEAAPMNPKAPTPAPREGSKKKATEGKKSNKKKHTKTVTNLVKEIFGKGKGKKGYKKGTTGKKDRKGKGSTCHKHLEAAEVKDSNDMKHSKGSDDGSIKKESKEDRKENSLYHEYLDAAEEKNTSERKYYHSKGFNDCNKRTAEDREDKASTTYHGYLDAAEVKG